MRTSAFATIGLASLMFGGCGSGDSPSKGAPEVCKHHLYADLDHDGLGDPHHPVAATAPCGEQADVADNADDKADNCATNDVDSCGVCHGPGPKLYYADTNMDGLADLPLREVHACAPSTGLVEQSRELPAGCKLGKNQVCVESAACNSNCNAPRCGDEVVNASAGEECDPTDAPDGTCAGCKRVEGFKLEVSAEAFGGLCVTSNDEIYVAAGKELFKIENGTVTWKVDVGGTEPIADIACDPTNGVGAVFGQSVQRFGPDSTPAYAPLALNPGLYAGRVLMQGDGTLMLGERSQCSYFPVACDGFATLEISAAGAQQAESISWSASGWPLAIGLADTGKLQIMFWENALTDVQWWHTSVDATSGPGDFGFAVNGTDHMVGAFGPQGPALLIQDNGEFYVFGDTGYPIWPKLLLDRSSEQGQTFAVWPSGGHLLASFVDGAVWLSEITTGGQFGKVLKTGFASTAVERVVGLAPIGESDLVMVSQGAKLVVQRIAFGRRATN